MNTATHQDIRRIFPAIQDHAVAEILDMKASVNELEAVLALLSSDDMALIEIKRREGGQITDLWTF